MPRHRKSILETGKSVRSILVGTDSKENEAKAEAVIERKQTIKLNTIKTPE